MFFPGSNDELQESTQIELRNEEKENSDVEIGVIGQEDLSEDSSDHEIELSLQEEEEREEINMEECEESENSLEVEIETKDEETQNMSLTFDDMEANADESTLFTLQSVEERKEQAIVATELEEDAESEKSLDVEIELEEKNEESENMSLSIDEMETSADEQLVVSLQSVEEQKEEDLVAVETENETEESDEKPSEVDVEIQEKDEEIDEMSFSIDEMNVTNDDDDEETVFTLQSVEEKFEHLDLSLQQLDVDLDIFATSDENSEMQFTIGEDSTEEFCEEDLMEPSTVPVVETPTWNTAFVKPEVAKKSDEELLLESLTGMTSPSCSDSSEKLGLAESFETLNDYGRFILSLSEEASGSGFRVTDLQVGALSDH